MARIAFIQPLSFEYIGTESLAAVLKADDHAVAVFIENEPTAREYRERLSRFQPDILAFSCTTGVHRWALATAASLSQQFPAALRVFGGPHPTFFPRMIEQEPVDVICRGEGEGALVDLARAVSTGGDSTQIPNLWVKKEGKVYANDVRQLIDNLDSLPHPDRSIYFDPYPFLKSSRLPFLTGRGCPYNCSYCFNHALKELYRNKGPYLRRRSPENVIEEIAAAVRTFGISTVYFQDDTFLIDHRWIAEFLPLYHRSITLPFICLATADKLNHDTVKLLHEAGCSRIFFGVESGNEALRQTVLHKNISDAQLQNAAALLKEFHIPFRTYNMVGLPGETLEQAFSTVQLNQTLHTDYPWCSLYQALPGTDLAQQARACGLTEENSGGQHASSFFQLTVADIRIRREFINLHKLFTLWILFRLPVGALRRVIRLPYNPVFNLLFIVGYAWCYMRSERLKFREMVSIGMRNYHRLLTRQPLHP